MQIENSFAVNAAPDTVFEFLLDINRVVGCMPGAELSEVVDPETFKGKVKIKVGPITVAYNGTARIVERDVPARRAVLEASGKETTGPGSAQAKATMVVTPEGSGSTVTLSTDFTVAGRVANFGRGVMEDVSRRLVGQMATCIKDNLEGAQVAAPPAGPPATEGIPEMSAAEAPVMAEETAPPVASAPAAAPAPAKPVNAISLFFGVLWDRIRRLFGSK
ncbi:MAG TPA: SRPBCC family protein [Candidatus Dormibacteraeota bacterium]